MALTPISDATPGTVITVYQNGDGSWPARPTSRTDITILWVSTVAASSGKPATATPPALTGSYDHDLSSGA